MNRRLVSVTAGIGLGLAVTAFFALRSSQGAAPSEGTSPFLDAPWPAPELGLVDTEGREARLSEFGGRWVALFFGYTFCPDVCPITLAQLSRLVDELDPEARDLQILFVTVDPQRDTPERLAQWTSAFHPSVRALTGSLDEVREVAWNWGIGVRYRPLETSDGATPSAAGAQDRVPPGVALDVPPASGPYLVDHTARTFLIDPQGQVVAQISPEPDGASLAEALRRILDS